MQTPDPAAWPRISDRTELYAVLGHPIGHSLSPCMHNASFRSLGRDAVYLAFDVGADRLGEVLDALSRLRFRGANLTVPLKETAREHMDALDAEAERLGSVNTVAFGPDGRRVGYCTDGVGFLRAYREAFDEDLRGARVAVIGAGGAARAVALTLVTEEPAELIIVNRTEQKAVDLVEEIHKAAPTLSASAVSGEEGAVHAVSRADVVLQGTSLGLKEGDASPVPAEVFHTGQTVVDMIYRAGGTRFLQDAEAAGAQVADGLGMLLHQGAVSFEHWTGETADLEAMRSALQQGREG